MMDRINDAAISWLVRTALWRPFGPFKPTKVMQATCQISMRGAGGRARNFRRKGPAAFNHHACQPDTTPGKPVGASARLKVYTGFGHRTPVGGTPLVT